MKRLSWLDETNTHPRIEAHLERLEHFTRALADGVITTEELAEQERNLVEAMKSVEPELDDALHAKVTTLLVELTAYNMMVALHELASAQLRPAASE